MTPYCKPACAFFAALLGIAVASAQPAPQLGAEAESGQEGWHILSASAYSGYMNLAEPGIAAGVASPVLGSDIQYGGALGVSWRRFRRGSGIDVTYTPSYYGLVRNSGWNALNHSVSLRATKTFSSSWSASLSATGSVRSLSGFMYAPTALSSAVAASGSAGNLANAVLTGQYANQQLASAFGGEAGLESPLTAELYGQKVLSGSFSAGLTYKSSSHLSVSFSATGSQRQSLNGSEPAGAVSTAVVPRTTMETVGASLSYAADSRTTLGVEASEGRSVSSLVDADITRATASVGRRIGVHWFVQGKGGAAAVSPIHEITQVSESAQLVANGSLGYRLISQTFIATFDRTPSISYGIGSGNTTAVGGAWQWRPLGRTWSLSANIRQQTIRETSSGSLTGWLGSGTLFKAVSRRVGIQFAYSYLNNTGTSIAGLRNLKVQTVQTALVWRSAAAR